MKGDPKIIAHLNTILRNELTAINQYFLHSRMLKDWGLSRMAKHEYDESIDEMKHADQLIERILFLEGLPKLEEKAIPDLRVAIADCEQVSDYVSRELLTEILASEEGHVDWLETNLGLIDKVGLQNYLQSQMDGDAS